MLSRKFLKKRLPVKNKTAFQSFAADAEWGLFDHIKMQQELQALLQRNVDLISKRALARSQNRVRRQEILNTAQVLFSEQEATQTMKV